MFQCQSSLRENKTIFITPNIPDSYFNPTNAFDHMQNESLMSLTSRVLVYPEFMLNCSGTLRHIEYCYRTRSKDIDQNMSKPVFDFSFLSQNGLNFRVTNTISISDSPRQDNCEETDDSHTVCCTAQFINHTVTPNFSFGITISKPRLLFFSDNATTYS